MLNTSPTTSDERLWQASCEGDRDAFGRIVDRYQALICALAYSGTGNLASSQDLAQETFVTAWQRLGELREPSKLKQWLCGIARNLAANSVRRELRRGGAPAALDAIAEPAAATGDPEMEAVSREEEALLWRALEGLPETYREPLVLFYRQESPIADVARQLDLSEDAVKQRLSRGRAMLREEMATMVESVLGRSRPTPAAFTAAVLGALSAAGMPTTAGAATLAGAGGSVVGSVASTVASSAASASAKALGTGAAAGPAFGLLTAWLSSRLAMANARSAPEAKLIGRAFARSILFTFAMIGGLLLALVLGYELLQEQPWIVAVGGLVWTIVLLLGLMFGTTDIGMRIKNVRAETGTEDAAYAGELAKRGMALPSGKGYVSPWRFLGLPLFAYGIGGLDVGAYRSRIACGWIAIGDLAISPLLAIGGIAIAPLSLGGVTVGLLSLSLAGLAFGGVAVGSLAFGWIAFGAVAVGWKAAAGGTALANDYAVGGLVRAAEANTAAAQAYFASQPVAPLVAFFFQYVIVWLVALCIVVPLTLLARRAWKLRR